MADVHAENVAKFCRVCGLLLSKAVNVKDIKSDLKNYFYINVDSDVEGIHPPKVCFKCYLKMRTVEQRTTTTQHKIIHCSVHSHTACCVCDSVEKLKKGGGPMKKKHAGRPSSQTQKYWSRQDTLGFYFMFILC